MAPPVGVLRDDRVIVEEERDANQLYNKGFFGLPLSGGALELELHEAVYLAEMNRLRVTDGDAGPIDPGALLVRAARDEPELEVRYVVYRDLRQRGYVTRVSNVTDFNVYPRGGLPGRTPSKFLVRATSERGAFDAAAVAEEADRCGELNKRLLLAVVDEEGDLTYYSVSTRPPNGETPPEPPALADAPRATLLGDRVIVRDEGTVDALQEREVYGRRVGPILQLSLAESLYLVEEAGLPVTDTAEGNGALDANAFRARAREAQPDFDVRYRLFRDLKSRGLIVKTGFKYGTHFRAYAGHPNEAHAPYLCHGLPEDHVLPWPEVAGFIRLAHGVRKELHFHARDAYVCLKRTRP